MCISLPAAKAVIAAVLGGGCLSAANSYSAARVDAWGADIFGTIGTGQLNQPLSIASADHGANSVFP